MVRVIVTGCGTGVGKTVVSAILKAALQGDYWKPVECGESDTEMIKGWFGTEGVHPPAYKLQAPFSPHHAARLEGIALDPSCIIPPRTDRPLIIETAGGIFVPLHPSLLAIDLYQLWNARWVVVSRHYVGSINHTLLTIEALQRRGIRPLLLFNGDPNPDSEEAILQFSRLPILGRLLPEPEVSSQILVKYVHLWRSQILNHIH